MDFFDRKLKLSSLFQGDKVLWILVMLLCVVSILVIYSSTASMAYRKLDGDTTYYLGRQVFMVVVGILAAIIFQFINYKRYYTHARTIFYISLGILSLTFIVGTEYNEAVRWIKVGGITFQPSDIAKITLVMILAKELSMRQNIIAKIPIIPVFLWSVDKERAKNVLFKVSMPLLFPIFITVLIIMISNLSTAIIVGMTSLIVLIIGRVRMKEIFSLLLVTICAFILVILLLKAFNVGRVDTWESRIESFFSDDNDIHNKNLKDIPVEQFQRHQARVAVAAGWLGGVGPGNSTQRATLPHPYSDYAYAFIVEEYGLIGAVFVLSLYLAIFYRALILFRRCRTAFPALLVLGLSLVITMQAMLHMIVSVDAGPVTGQTLPLISWGGSSLVFTCISIGIIQNVARRVEKEQKESAINAERHLVLEEWSQIEIDDERTEYDEDNTVVLTDNEYEEEVTAQNIDSLLQKNRLSEALNKERYQSVVIWGDKKEKEDEDNI